MRSGRGFLPPRKGTAEGWTGSLIRRQWCNDGFPVVLPVHKGSEEHQANIEAACCLEEKIWIDARVKFKRKRRQVERHGEQSVLGKLVRYYFRAEEIAPVDAPAWADRDR